jgi:hypothetical protein
MTEPGAAFVSRKKREDTAAGCRSMAQDDRDRAADIPNDHMRSTMERSADAWTARADLLERLEASFNARAEANGDETAADGADESSAAGDADPKQNDGSSRA